jgi:phage tail-like protein
MPLRNDPLRNFRFRLEIDGTEQAGFSEVSGLDATVDPIEYHEGIEPRQVRKSTGLTRYGNVTMKWGVTGSNELHDWHRQIVDGEIQRENVVIIVVDESGQDRARFEIVEAWPCKYAIMDLKAKGNGVSIETLELCNEGITRIA